MSEEKYRKAARIIIKAGAFPFPINDILIEILQSVIDEIDLDFIMSFRRKVSQTIEELRKSSKMSDEQILASVNRLAKVGLIFNQPNSKGIMVYRLMPLLMVGIFEYLFMKKIDYTEEELRLAKRFSELFKGLTNFIQDQYDIIVPAIFQNLPPFDRTIPNLGSRSNGEAIEITVNKEIDVPPEKILPMQRVEELVNKFDDIAVGHCFCRHHQDLLGNPCNQTSLRENCFTFGKSAKYTSEQGFARLISKEEAIKILKASERDGLVHKAFHPHSDIYKDETSVCNCCKCCCGMFDWWRSGMSAIINSTNYLSQIDSELCAGCGTCVENCPVDAIELLDGGVADRKEELCIGCGVCARACPEGAISLLEGMRTVYIPPPKLKKNT